MLSARGRRPIAPVVEPIARALNSMGVSPNAMTVFGTVAAATHVLARSVIVAGLPGLDGLGARWWLLLSAVGLASAAGFWLVQTAYACGPAETVLAGLTEGEVPADLDARITKAVEAEKAYLASLTEGRLSGFGATSTTDTTQPAPKRSLWAQKGA